MKTLRGLYLVVAYIVALPMLLIGMVLVLFTNINHPLKTLKSLMWGLWLSHKTNVVWVKTGQRNLYHQMGES